MEAQSFHHPSPNSIAAGPEVLLPLGYISSSVDSSRQPPMTTVNEISPIFDTNQAMYLMQSSYHPSPPATSPFDPRRFPQLNAFSPEPTVIMNENNGLNQFLTMPNPNPSFLCSFGAYSGTPCEFATSALNLPEPTTYDSKGYLIGASPEDHPAHFDLWPGEVVPFSNQFY